MHCFTDAPVVRVLNSRIGQMLRRETVLECTVTSYPRSKITWFKNGREVHHSYRYRIELYDGKFDTWSLSLQILNINESDYGDYVCEAKNIMGEDRAVTALYGTFFHASLARHILKYYVVLAGNS